MLCVCCHKEIREGESSYRSRQAGMKGFYHWGCFVEACRQANKVGAQEIEQITVSDTIFDNVSTLDAVSE